MHQPVFAKHGFLKYGDSAPSAPAGPVVVADSGTSLAIPVAIVVAAIVVVIGLRNKKS